MKLALVLLALTSTAFSQTPTQQPPPASSPAQTAPAPTQTPVMPPAQTPAPGSVPAASPAPTAAKPATPAAAIAVTPQPPPPMPKPEDHNGPAYKNPKSTLPKVAGIPHVLYSLKYIDTKVGTGPLAEPHKFYSVNYTGWFTDGTKFDSSFDHTPKEPITFPYGAQRVIIGWDTGFEGMRIGGKRRLYVPYQLAYGLTGRPPKMGPKANLIFDVELVSQSDKPPTPPAGSRPPGATGMPGGMTRPGAPGSRTPPPAQPSTTTPHAPATPSAPAAHPAPATPPASATPPAPSATPATPPAPTKPPTA